MVLLNSVFERIMFESSVFILACKHELPVLENNVATLFLAFKNDSYGAKCTIVQRK